MSITIDVRYLIIRIIDGITSEISDDIERTYISDPIKHTDLKPIGLDDKMEEQSFDYFYKTIRIKLGIDPKLILPKEVDDRIKTETIKITKRFCKLISENDTERNYTLLSKFKIRELK